MGRSKGRQAQSATWRCFMSDRAGQALLNVSGLAWVQGGSLCTTHALSSKVAPHVLDRILLQASRAGIVS